MRVMSVVGARPQFVKLAPVSQQLAVRAEHEVVHTGQHYDDVMSESFFRDLGIPSPDVNLAIGSGTHGKQTAAMIDGLERVFSERRPDWVLCYGDTNSTIAAALAAVKLHIPVAHLEAGLRSFNRRMPEEHNRVLTDHAADLCLAPSEVAMGHLRNEGLGQRSVLVGDVMTDILYRVRDEVAGQQLTLPAAVVDGHFYLATIHRPDNTDSEVRLRGIVSALAELDLPVLLAVHPRLAAKAREHGIELDTGALRPIAPLSYPDLVNTVQRSRGVVTDSGGLQKECFLLHTPCTTIRPETEWVETLENGWNVLVNAPLSQIGSVVRRPAPALSSATPYGDGNAAGLVVDALLARS